MRTVSDVIEFLYENGLTVVEDNVVQVAEAKNVQRDFEGYQIQELSEKLVSVYQKKKGKPTKKVTAFALVKEGHVTYLEYAVMTSDVDFRELFRACKVAA